jgi:hypothetical protein
MTDSCFVDTNILVYARDSGAGAKQKKAEALLEELWISCRGRLSVQVLNEYFVAVTQKLSRGSRPGPPGMTSTLCAPGSPCLWSLALPRRDVGTRPGPSAGGRPSEWDSIRNMPS